MKVCIVVPTKVLKDQWEENLFKRDLEATVLVLNTAAKKPFKCDFLIVDELHKAAADQWAKIFPNANARLIMGLTATYERLDGKEKIVLDKWVPVCDVISLQESKENGWISPYNEYKVMLEVDLTNYKRANAEFINHFSFFDYDFKLALDCVTNVFAQQKVAKLYNCTLKEVKAHAFAWNKALRFRKDFIANHPYKIEVAKRILAARPEAKAITFNSSIAQCEAYGFGYVIHSKNSKKKNAMTMEEFSHCDKGVVVHSSKSLIEGVDVPGLNLAIIAGFNSSKTNKIQELGRVVRAEPGKVAEIFTLVLKGTVEESWAQKAGEDMEVTVINEEELNIVLDNNKIDKKQTIITTLKSDLLRF